MPRKDLASVSLASHHFRALTTPHIFSKLAISANRPIALRSLVHWNHIIQEVKELSLYDVTRLPARRKRGLTVHTSWEHLLLHPSLSNVTILRLDTIPLLPWILEYIADSHRSPLLKELHMLRVNVEWLEESSRAFGRSGLEMVAVDQEELDFMVTAASATIHTLTVGFSSGLCARLEHHFITQPPSLRTLTICSTYLHYNLSTNLLRSCNDITSLSIEEYRTPETSSWPKFSSHALRNIRTSHCCLDLAVIILPAREVRFYKQLYQVPRDRYAGAFPSDEAAVTNLAQALSQTRKPLQSMELYFSCSWPALVFALKERWAPFQGGPARSNFK